MGVKPVSSQRIIGVYTATLGLSAISTSIIWGVNTLFLIGAGLDIFQVMIVNASFSVGQIIFEVPTGVVADTIGRRASLLAGIAVLAVSTIMYVAAAELGWGIGPFIFASVLLGLGYTFQTGAVDAWFVDALDHTGYDGPREKVFARGGMVFGGAMLIGTLGGGLLGQIDLSLPYYARSAVLLMCLAVTAVLVRDVGFEPRPLRRSTFRAETLAILDAGVKYGWRHPVVRPMLFASFATGLFFMYGFYSWQPYALELLGRDYVWLVGALVAGFSAAGILGNSLVGKVMTRRDGSRRDPARVLAWLLVLIAVCIAGAGAVGLITREPGVVPLGVASFFWLVWGWALGVIGPVRQAFLNDQIPSAQRATVLSVDSFFGEAGGGVGQPGLGALSRTSSIPLSWVIGAGVIALAAPLYASAGRRCRPGSGVVPAPATGEAVVERKPC